ncbi:GNAT family N-acetyltransferase [Tumebacillus sp. ITR2]|uniref:GNAT family N-acetyltransferase n=1 Tax=Tumebacillus amylolyticus TaxID=2801339 RepID=A0ABS1JF73_9BACL|nr:GNAT family protein [Tumebacillus amylolyticus]MBL0388213.1 GNAT family N-acetyltransferase [Tumebacillus amylolyticus]
MKLMGEQVYLRTFTENDADTLLGYLERNHEFFAQFEPSRPDRTYSLELVHQQLENGQRAWDRDEAYSLGVFLRDSDKLVGRIALNFVARGPLQSAMIGYTMDRSQNGKGLGSEAVRLCTAFGFEHLKLHRIEAGIMPSNFGSKRVVEKAGYTFEGIHRKSLLVQGAWVDLEFWAILEEEWSAR